MHDDRLHLHKSVIFVFEINNVENLFPKIPGFFILAPAVTNLGISPSKCKQVYLVNIAVVCHRGLVRSKTRACCHFQYLLATLKKHRKVEYQVQITQAFVIIPNIYVGGG